MSYQHHNDDLIPASFHSNQAGHRSRTDNQSGAHPNVIFGVTFKGPTRVGWIMFLLSRDVDVAFCGFLSHSSMALNNSATFNSWATLNSGGLAFCIISRNSSQHEICYLAVKIEEEKKSRMTMSFSCKQSPAGQQNSATFQTKAQLSRPD